MHSIDVFWRCSAACRIVHGTIAKLLSSAEAVAATWHAMRSHG